MYTKTLFTHMNNTLVYLQNDIENRERRSVLPFFLLLGRFTCSALLTASVHSFLFLQKVSKRFFINKIISVIQTLVIHGMISLLSYFCAM